MATRLLTWTDTSKSPYDDADADSVWRSSGGGTKLSRVVHLEAPGNPCVSSFLENQFCDVWRRGFHSGRDVAVVVVVVVVVAVVAAAVVVGVWCW